MARLLSGIRGLNKHIGQGSFRSGIGTCVTKGHGGFHTGRCFLVNGPDLIGVEYTVIKEFFAVAADRTFFSQMASSFGST